MCLHHNSTKAGPASSKVLCFFFLKSSCSEDVTRIFLIWIFSGSTVHQVPESSRGHLVKALDSEIVKTKSHFQKHSVLVNPSWWAFTGQLSVSSCPGYMSGIKTPSGWCWKTNKSRETRGHSYWKQGHQTPMDGQPRWRESPWVKWRAWKETKRKTREDELSGGRGDSQNK